MTDRFPLTLRYLRSVLQHRLVFTGMVVCMIGAGLLQPLLPLGLAPLLDASSQKEYLIPPAALPYFMLGTIALLSIFSYGRGYLGGWLDATLQRDFRNQMAQSMLHLPLAHLQQESSGKATSRFMIFLPQLTGGTLPVCMALVQETLRALGYIALMAYWQWQLTLIVLLAAPIGAGMIRILKRRMKHSAAAGQDATAATQSQLNEILAAAPLVKMAGEQAAGSRLHRAFSTLRGKVLRINVILHASQPLTHFLLALPFAVVIAFVVSDLSSGKLSAGQAASFLTAMMLLPTPVRVITRAINVWEQMLVAAREVYGYMDSAREPDSGTRELPRSAAAAITFRNVHFRYDSTAGEVLSDFSLHIAAGEKVALVGRSGAGKTTLCNLLPRFFLPQGGKVLLNDTDINDYTLASLRRQIMLITQKPHLFTDTVAANVAFPDTPAPAVQERITAALRAAAAEDFVHALPQGADTPIGEGGNTLSGGQQQRLMLARAFYWDAPIVILDEPTSALDSETEVKIKAALRQLLAGRTAILIAHRFATLDLADRIVVVDQGKVLASGTAQELRQTCPLFAAMYDAQRLTGEGEKVGA